MLLFLRTSGSFMYPAKLAACHKSHNSLRRYNEILTAGEQHWLVPHVHSFPCLTFQTVMLFDVSAREKACQTSFPALSITNSFPQYVCFVCEMPCARSKQKRN